MGRWTEPLRKKTKRENGIEVRLGRQTDINIDTKTHTDTQTNTYPNTNSRGFVAVTMTIGCWVRIWTAYGTGVCCLG